jgi:hypothetical protein
MLPAFDDAKGFHNATNKRDYELTAKITRLPNRGIKKSIELAKKRGIPNPFAIDGLLMLKMPDGTIKPATRKN